MGKIGKTKEIERLVFLIKIEENTSSVKYERRYKVIHNARWQKYL
jgi:hypothetical protein